MLALPCSRVRKRIPLGSDCFALPRARRPGRYIATSRRSPKARPIPVPGVMSHGRIQGRAENPAELAVQDARKPAAWASPCMIGGTAMMYLDMFALPPYLRVREPATVSCVLAVPRPPRAGDTTPSPRRTRRRCLLFTLTEKTFPCLCSSEPEERHDHQEQAVLDHSPDDRPVLLGLPAPTHSGQEQHRKTYQGERERHLHQHLQVPKREQH